MPAERLYTATVTDHEGRVDVPVPFDPDEVWGAKPRHHVAGSVAGMGVRGVVEDVRSGRARGVPERRRRPWAAHRRSDLDLTKDLDRD